MSTETKTPISEGFIWYFPDPENRWQEILYEETVKGVKVVQKSPRRVIFITPVLSYEREAHRICCERFGNPLTERRILAIERRQRGTRGISSN